MCKENCNGTCNCENCEEVEVNENVENVEEQEDKQFKVDPNLVKKIHGMGDSELYTYLTKSSNSDLLILVDYYLSEKQKHKLNDLKKFAEIKVRYSVTMSHDRKPATMSDIDRACTLVYKMLLKMISQLNKEVTLTQEAINEIEKHLGKSITEWVEDQNQVQESESNE